MKILKLLKDTHPDVEAALDFENPYQLLVATIQLNIWQKQLKDWKAEQLLTFLWIAR